MQSRTKDVSNLDDAKYSTLDGLRGLGAVFILFRHAIGIIVGSTFAQSYLAVDLFFLMSGFVIARSYERKLLNGDLRPSSFLSIRLLRLYPLYFLGVIVGVLDFLIRHALLPASNATSFTTLAWDVLYALLLIPKPFGVGGLFALNGPSWSLSLEVFANAVYGSVVKVLGTRVLIIIAFVCAAFLTIVCLQVHSLDLGYQRNLLDFVAGLARIGFSFSIGIVLYRHRIQRREESNLISGLCLIATGGLLAGHFPKGFSSTYPLFVIFVGFPLLLRYGACFEPTAGLKRIFVFSGATSYGVYILHAPLASILGNLSVHVWRLRLVDYFPWTLLFVPAIVAVVTLVDRLYDRPVRTALSHRFRPSPPSLVVREAA